MICQPLSFPLSVSKRLPVGDFKSSKQRPLKNKTLGFRELHEIAERLQLYELPTIVF